MDNIAEKAQKLSIGEYLLYKSGKTYSMNSCETIEMFYNIRTDLDKLKCASNITKIVNDVTTENQNSFNTLKLFLNTLYMISETDKNMDLILSIFELRLLCILGFMPIVDRCVQCGNSETLEYFSLKDNGFKCNTCGKQDKGAIEISEATQNAIKYIIKAPAKKIFSFNISEENIYQLKLVSKIYLNNKLEKEYKL